MLNHHNLSKFNEVTMIQAINQLSPNAPTPQQKAADGMEKAFLTEMLKYAGPRPMQGEFGGGIGEDQFSSMLVETYADALAARLNIGFDKV